MYCGNCGQLLSLSDKFCKKCGSQVKKEAVTPTRKEDKALYLFVASVTLLWSLGFLFCSFIFMVEKIGGYGYEYVLNRVFFQYWGITTTAILFCVFIMFKGKFTLTKWKVLRIIMAGILSLAICFVTLFNIAIHAPVMASIEAYEWMLGRAIFVAVLLAIIAVATLGVGIVIGVKKVRLFEDKNCELYSAVLGAVVWAILISVPLYLSMQ